MLCLSPLLCGGLCVVGRLRNREKESALGTIPLSPARWQFFDYCYLYCDTQRRASTEERESLCK